jgi:hypothetical protein
MTQKLKAVSLTIAVLAVFAIFAWVRHLPTVQAQDNLVPGMLFGPLAVGFGQHIELCMSNLNEGDIVALVHFRNITTGEVTVAQKLTVKSGQGGCVSYFGQGLGGTTGRDEVVGMTRGDTVPVDWVSPSNALIGTMSVLNEGRTQAAVLGIPRLWLKGL